MCLTVLLSRDFNINSFPRLYWYYFGKGSMFKEDLCYHLADIPIVIRGLWLLVLTKGKLTYTSTTIA